MTIIMIIHDHPSNLYSYSHFTSNTSTNIPPKSSESAEGRKTLFPFCVLLKCIQQSAFSHVSSATKRYRRGRTTILSTIPCHFRLLLLTASSVVYRFYLELWLPLECNFQSVLAVFRPKVLLSFSTAPLSVSEYSCIASNRQNRPTAGKFSFLPVWSPSLYIINITPMVCQCIFHVPSPSNHNFP